jgi:RsiW-degrading membrane proteinase PrsW (M82 family)
MSSWQKRAIAIGGLLLALPGLFVALGYFCATVILVAEGDREAIGVGLASFTLMVLTLGAGGVTFWHGWRSLQGRESKPLRLPPIWLLAALFGLFVAMGLVIAAPRTSPPPFWGDRGSIAAIFFPPILLIAASLPPLMAMSWFMGHRSGGLTWRRGVVAFAGGATVSVFVAVVLEILLPVIILALVFGLAGIVRDSVETVFEALAGQDVASAITSPGFIYIFVQVAIIAPLAEELAKPLITLPLVGRLARREAFLVGAMAGAGFAALENVIYAGFGFYFWAGILLVRGLGGAIHPLGSGLVALGWRDIRRGETGAWPRWFARFGLAAGIHALWNGGSLLVITLAGAGFFGELPPELNVLGLSAAGTTLALLIILGLAAMWLGRAVVQQTPLRLAPQDESDQFEFTLSDRAIAIWALACLVTIVPAGIAGLQLLVR